MKIYISPITFCGKPENYVKVDDLLSRSAQPQKEDFRWLKEHGITDVINFRTMYRPAIDFNEKEVVENLGMKYHNIPSITRRPKEKNVYEFLNTVAKINQSGGKVHIHCKAGADRTGMYAFIYKSLKNIGKLDENLLEWVNLGHDRFSFPHLMGWAENFVKNFKK